MAYGVNIFNYSKYLLQLRSAPTLIITKMIYLRFVCLSNVLETYKLKHFEIKNFNIKTGILNGFQFH